MKTLRDRFNELIEQTVPGGVKSKRELMEREMTFMAGSAVTLQLMAELSTLPTPEGEKGFKRIQKEHNDFLMRVRLFSFATSCPPKTPPSPKPSPQV